VNIFDLLRQWKDSQTIIELHYIHAGAKKVVHGRIYSFDPDQQQLLFYDEDRKSVENISLSQIEDAIAAIASPKETARSAPEKRSEEEKALTGNGNGPSSEVDATMPPAKPDKKNHDLKEEIVFLISELGAPDLYALYPMIKHLAKQQEKRTVMTK
jgi:hypothetical protein